MKIRLRLQTLVGLIVIGVVVPACGSAAPTSTSIAEVQEQGPAVQIGSAALGPDKTMSVCAGQTVALTTKTTGRDLTYAWSVDGNGQLQRQEGKGDVASSNRYTAPTTTGEEVVKVTVIDDLNQSSTDQVIIQVVECAAVAEATEGSTEEMTEEPAVTTTITEEPPPPECFSARPPLEGAADFAGRVEVTTPRNCTTGLPTETPIAVTGTYEEIPEGVDIWVLAYPPNVIYYPQSPNACAGTPPSHGNGNWQVPAYLGGKGGAPEWFDIVVVLADEAASQFLSDWVRQGCQSGYKGIPADQLEQMNITEKASITVQTLD